MKKFVFYTLSFISMTFVLLACQQKPQSQLILFLENEEGIDPYQTRIMVTPDYMRFDDGGQSTTFLLIDRKKKVAYSVNHDMQTTMRVERQDVEVAPPIELNFTVKEVDDFKDAPKINNNQPKHRQLLTNDQVCLDVISVDGLMPEAVAALKEYHQLLAADSAITFNIMPADMHDPCTISMSTFAPTRHLEYGFPIQEWKPGYARSLETYDENYQVDPKLLKLPENYFNYSIQEFREGRVDFDNRKIIPATGQGNHPSEATKDKSTTEVPSNGSPELIPGSNAGG